MAKRKTRSVQNFTAKRIVRKFLPSPRLTLNPLRNVKFETPMAKLAAYKYGLKRVILFAQPVARALREAITPRSRLPDFPLLVAPRQRDFSKKKTPCAKRQIRREILFAAKRVGRGSGNSKIHKFTDQSKEHC